jgi:uncharacterized membrane protein
MRRFRIVHALAQCLWIIPSLGLLSGILLSLVTVAIDRRNENQLLSQSIVGNAADAQSILTTIATAVVTLTSMVLTVTLVAVQLAMGQFSPRIVRALLDDRGDQLAIAVFGATFTFTVFSLRAIDTGPPGQPVPGVTVLTALALAAASAFALFVFVHHAGQQLRVGTLVDLVGDELLGQLDRRFPPGSEPREDASVLLLRGAGNVVHYDRDGLVAEARRAGCTLELVPMMGDFVTRGAPLVRVQGDGAPRPRARTATYRARQRADPRRRPGVRVPQARRRRAARARYCGERRDDCGQGRQPLHGCLRQIADRPFPNGHLRDEDDESWLIERVLDWDGYVRLAFDEIRLAAGGFPQVTRRLEAAPADLKTVAPAERQPALDRQLRLLARAVERRLEDEDDRRAALVADAQASARASTSQSARQGRPLRRSRRAPPRLARRRRQRADDERLDAGRQLVAEVGDVRRGSEETQNPGGDVADVPRVQRRAATEPMSARHRTRRSPTKEHQREALNVLPARDRRRRRRECRRHRSDRRNFPGDQLQGSDAAAFARLARFSGGGSPGHARPPPRRARRTRDERDKPRLQRL